MALEGITPHRKDVLLAKVYFADIEGKIKSGAEIVEAKWVKDTEDYNLSNITRKVINHLKQGGYL